MGGKGGGEGGREGRRAELSHDYCCCLVGLSILFIFILFPHLKREDNWIEKGIRSRGIRAGNKAKEGKRRRGKKEKKTLTVVTGIVVA